MVDVGKRGLRERAQRLAGDDDDLLAHDRLHAHAVGGELAVGRCVGAERKQRRVTVGRAEVYRGVHRL